MIAPGRRSRRERCFGHPDSSHGIPGRQGRREGAAAELEHGLSDGTGSPDEMTAPSAVAFIDDPGGRRAAGRGIESRSPGYRCRRGGKRRNRVA